MARRKASTTTRDESIDSPTAWFAVLERARLIEDYVLAAKAKQELVRLGVRVRFVRPKYDEVATGITS